MATPGQPTGLLLSLTYGAAVSKPCCIPFTNLTTSYPQLNNPLFTLTPAIKGIATRAIDSLIGQLGKPCRLIYPSIMQPCCNCLYDPLGKKSSNRWRSGGPIQFANGTICPMCGGAGARATENTDTILMLCSFEPRDWLKFTGSLGLTNQMALRLPNGGALTKAFLTDLPKVQRCSEAILGTGDEAFIRGRYKLAGEPIDPSNILPGRYMLCAWERAG